MDSLTLAKTAAGILDAKKADQINVIRISDVSSLGDYFVLANGTGSTHVHALADELEFKLKELGPRGGLSLRFLGRARLRNGGRTHLHLGSAQFL